MDIKSTGIEQSLATTTIDSKNKKLKETCQDFEAILVGYMFKSMRGASNTEGVIKKNMGEEIFTEMLDGEYSKMASKSNTLGLSDILYKQLSAKTGQHQDLNKAISNYKDSELRSKISVKNFQAENIISNNTNNINLVKQVSKYNSIINVAARDFGVSPHIIRGVIAQESGGNKTAISNTGAKGLMQLMDSTSKELGVKNVFDPKQNIRAGTKYLKMMLEKFNGNITNALASYNAGASNVEKYGGIPPFKETQNYVKKVMNYSNIFKNYYERGGYGRNI